MTKHSHSPAATRTWRRIIAATIWIAFAMCGTSFAQSVGSSTLNGIVSDGTGGALPGVTVTLTSPALQVGQVVAVTTPDGSYRFVDLPPGVFVARFELSGFKPLVRESLRLTVGFVARVDVTMQVGGIEESVTVSGQSPVVDVTSTSASVAFTRETLEAVPRGRDLQNVLAMAPGVTQPIPDVGGSNMANRVNISSYGVAAQPKLQVEGMNVVFGADQSAGVYFMDNTLEEVQIKTSGTDAEVSTPGISFVGVLKSGGNGFHGIYAAAAETPSLQADNLDDALRAQGLTSTSPLKSLYDVSADLGGRIVRDKLWFYVAQSRQKRAQGTVGFVAGPGPDGKYLTGDEPPADFHSQLDQSTGKVSFQASTRTRLIYAIQRDVKREPENAAGRFVPLEATRDYTVPHSIQKGEVQSTLSDRTLVNVVAGYVGYLTDYDAGRSYGRADAPPRMDLESGLATGTNPLHQVKPRKRAQADGGVSFFPRRPLFGTHEMKVGGNFYLDFTTDGYENNVSANYILETDRIGGVSGTPSQIVFYNTPSIPLDRENTYAVYAKDTWRLRPNVTVNLGVRWERQHAFLPAQSRADARDAPTIFPAGSFPYGDVGTWTRAVPRVGFAWDLGAKSVVKASVGEYNYMFGDTFGDQYNQNATGTATFRWHDVNGDKLYDPGEVNLSLNGPDFVNITAAKNARINPDLQQPSTWEATVSYEREIAPNLGIRAMYVDRTLVGYFSGTGPNVLRPYDTYSIPITRRDPGPDGVLGNGDDAAPVTFFDYRPEYRGAAFVSTELLNTPQNDHYRTLEFTATRRVSGRWSAQVSYFITRNHRLIQQTVNSPNDEFFPWDDTWNWAGIVTGTYRAKYDISLSAFLQSKSGLYGQRTNLFRQADPDGGTPIAQLNTVTLRLEDFGARQLAAQNILSVRASKEFSLGGSRRFAVDFDLYNLLNTNAPLAATFASGPTFGYVSNVIPARVAKFGARFRF